MPQKNKRILVIGIGGMGGNVLNSLVSDKNLTCTFLTVNTDAQALGHSLIKYKLLIGATVCKGLGTGGNVSRGKEAAARSLNEINTYLSYADTIILIAGLGGGTGSGAIQVIARYALDLQKQVFCIVSTPFNFEEKDKQLIAQEALRELNHISVQKIILNNQDLMKVANDRVTFADAFKVADDAIAKKIMKLLNGGKVNDDTPLAIDAATTKDIAANDEDSPTLTHTELEEIALGRLASLGMKPEALAEVKKSLLDGDPYGLLYGKPTPQGALQNVSSESEKNTHIKSAVLVVVMAYLLFGMGYSAWDYYKQHGLFSTLMEAGGLVQYPLRPLIWPILVLKSEPEASNDAFQAVMANLKESPVNVADDPRLPEGFVLDEAPNDKKNGVKIVDKRRGKFDKFIADGHDIDNEHDANIIIGLANSGDADAEFFMANLMMKNNEPEKAIFMTKIAAENGHPLAQHNLATAYEDGIGGLEKNTKLSRYWYEKAALNGFPPSMNNLANYYHDGEAVEKDMIRAYAWLEMALITFPYYAQSSEMMTPKFKEILVHNKQAIFDKLDTDEQSKALEIRDELKKQVVVITGY